MTYVDNQLQDTGIETSQKLRIWMNGRKELEKDILQW